MGVLAQETKIPTRNTTVAVPIVNGDRFATRPHVLMVYQNYPGNHPELLRPVQGGREKCDKSFADTAWREVGEETDVWLGQQGSHPFVPIPMPHYEGIPRDHCRRGLLTPRYLPYVALLGLDVLPATTPLVSEMIGAAGWYPLEEAYERSQLIERPETRFIIGEILLNAYDMAGYSLRAPSH